MCARYYIDDDLYETIETYPVSGEEFIRRTGDIRPSEKAPVLRAKEESVAAESMIWGYPGIDGKGLLINARAESVEEKQIFSEGIRKGRILIPVSGFYEWDREKNRVSFRLAGKKAFFLAGISAVFSGERRFTILTTEANASVKSVHDRMPLMIPKERITDWLLSAKYTELLKAAMPELLSFREYEQLSFGDIV